LGLAIAEFETRFADGPIAPFPAGRARQDALQAWTVGEALDAGNFLGGVLLLGHEKQLIEKHLVTKKMNDKYCANKN
jgi:hypothetical protein